MVKAAKTDRILRVAIGVLLGVLVSVIYLSLHEHIVQVDDTAPGFSITADNGHTISRSDFGGKLLVLNFWATWCPPCLEEWPSLNEFAARYKDKGVTVLAISVDKDEKAYKRFLDRAKVSFLTARDPDNKINAEYGTFKYPESYIINRDGKVVDKIVNATNWMDPKMLEFFNSRL